jgi:hypothetical protein
VAKMLKSGEMVSIYSMSGSISVALSRAWLMLNGCATFHFWPKPQAFSTTDLKRQWNEWVQHLCIYAAQHALAPDAAPLRFAAQVKRKPLDGPT